MLIFTAKKQDLQNLNSLTAGFLKSEQFFLFKFKKTYKNPSQ